MCSMTEACLTTDGFAVYIPLTSVQICSSEAFNAAAIMDAVKSEPPLPKVVVFPWIVLATKPGTMVTFCELVEKYSLQFLNVAGKSTTALL